MTLDLHAVLVRKQERDCARLDDFVFRARARTLRLFGEWLHSEGHDVDIAGLPPRVAAENDQAILDSLIDRHGGDARSWRRRFDRCRAEAEAELRRERGDPTRERFA